jgi:prolycopene isomerase
MTPTLSNFIVYLGIKKECTLPLHPGTFYYHMADYDVEKAYETVLQGDGSDYAGIAFRLSFDRTTIYTGRPARYHRGQYWKSRKRTMRERAISLLEERAVPGLSRYIEYKDAATPQTLERYTRNYHGASYGWAGTPSQIILPDLRRPSTLQNVYLVGHWTTFGVGVSGVAYVGFETANSLIKRYNRGI